MREKLTISEVAKLLDISAHTIRYYDKEGLITSDYDSENGYRLFDFEDIYRLSNVIILRDSGIAIKDIKELIRNYSKEHYTNQLKKSLNNIDQQIDKLKTQREVIKNNLNFLDFDYAHFEIKEYPKRYLKVVNEEKYDEEKSPKDFFRDIQKNNISNVLYKDVIYELRDEDMLICYESQQLTDVILESGKYLEYSIKLCKDSDINNAVSKMLEYSFNKQITMDEKLYMSIQPHAMLVVDNGYVAKLFSKINS